MTPRIQLALARWARVGGAQDLINRVLRFEEVVDRWFQLLMAVVAAEWASVLILSWYGQLTPAIVVWATIALIAIAFLLAIFGVRLLGRFIALSAALRRAGKAGKALDRTIRTHIAFRIALAVASFVFLASWLLIFPIEGLVTAALLWAIAILSAILALIASPESGVRSLMMALTLVFVAIAAGLSAATVESSPVNQATRDFIEWTEPDEVVITIYQSDPAPPAFSRPLVTPPGMVIVRTVEVSLTSDLYASGWTKNRNTTVNPRELWMVQLPHCESGGVEYEVGASPQHWWLYAGVEPGWSERVDPEYGAPVSFKAIGDCLEATIVVFTPASG
ncbi:MAG: hypothetical protein COT89_01975 [Candidatus Colwellbacteria bacterium CG10_big_fil_rev_8_21_14_0_10_42_22]|uniref:Uncharacterized protein n=1 Tax=Candidatus Colwellbacteria bacterium CG10_big_fil_rev_8_21_14_0_10_42_22 TaxID=1974540 RepID=A0A2H0VFW2_9BACT|nr:MAG: hypothetical protein COT89_01975 [Candidatus Colwellbacteria bacterium CG10_big_fil_rev_8_21_14_0_10_42_22]